MPADDFTDLKLAQALRRLRRGAGDTQETVAQAAGITVATLARIERGQTNPQWTTVRRIITALEVSLAELVAVIEDAAM